MVTGQSKGQFPSFIPKTDQKRIENLSFYFDMYKDHEFEETLKLDGSSCTMYKIEKKQTLLDIIKDKVLNFLFDTDFSNEHFGVCSRNLELREPDPEEKSSNFWDCAYKYKIKKSLPVGYSIQGEVLATNIQGNYEKVKETEYYIFNVYDINKREYLKPLHARTFVSKYLPEANYIPVINESIKIFSNENCSSIEELRNRIDSKSIYGAVSEGRVYKSTTDSKITFKAINPKYLLQKGK
jgi:RNA ligase (TIGR02306 family)